MAVLLTPTALAIASTISSAKRLRFSMEPPYSSVRELTASFMNWSTRNPFAPETSKNQELQRIRRAGEPTVHLHTVEAGPVDGISRRRGVELHVLFDLGRGQRAGLPRRGAELDVGRGDDVKARVLAPEDVPLRAAAERPKLHEDEGPLRVHRVCYL